MAEFLTTSGVTTEIERIINDSKQQVVLISPYLKISQRMKDLLGDADRMRRTVKIVFGKNELQPDESEWLQQRACVQLFFRKNLHAKCYLNEDRAVVTSMNLYEFSQVNNDEMGVLVTSEKDPELFAKISAESERLLRMSESWRFRVEKIVAEPPPPASRRTNASAPSRSRSARNGGFCIRCAERIPRSAAKPYCTSDYARWAEYGNPDYKDKYCHHCGEKNPSTLRKPLCKSCYATTSDEEIPF